MKNKKTLVKIGIAFLLVLVVFTFFSTTVRNSMLPKVQTVQPASGTLNQSLVIYDYEYVNTDTNVVLAEGNWIIKEVYVKEGDTVKEGDILYRIDTDKYRVELLRLQSDAVALDNQLASPYLSEEDRRVLELKSYAAWREYRTLSDSFPSSGEILAPASGSVSAVHIETYEELKLGQRTIEISDNESKLALRIDLSAQENSLYKAAENAEIQVKNAAKSEVINQPILKKEKNNNSYSYYVEIPDFMDGGEIIQFIKLEKKSASYDNIIPSSCIQYDIANSDYVYIVEEEKSGSSIRSYISKLRVIILESNETYTAIEFSSWVGSGLRIVHFSTKPVVQGSEVIVS